LSVDDLAVGARALQVSDEIERLQQRAVVQNSTQAMNAMPMPKKCCCSMALGQSSEAAW